MRWQKAEFIFKGIYLGLLLFAGLMLRERESWLDIVQVGVCTFATLALFLGVAALRKAREGYPVRGRFGAFVLFLILESPGMVYAAVLLGMLLGAYSLADNYSLFRPDLKPIVQAVGPEPPREEEQLYWLITSVLGGAAFGVVFNMLYEVRSLKTRRWLGVALGAGLIAAGIYAVSEGMPSEQNREMFAALLLLGMPLFYLLTLVSMAEETEVEIMAVCAALGVSLWIFAGRWFGGNLNFQLAVLPLPVGIYYIYTRFVLPQLRVFKHVLRGISYAKVGQMRPALLSLGRALQLAPANPVAREQMWHVHRLMDFKEVVKDPATLALLDFELCMGRVEALLLASKPKPQHLYEAQRLLDLVAGQRPAMAPRCDYWRAVALTHERRYDEAAAALERVLAGVDGEADNPQRQVILFSAWQLAVMLHPELTRRVGTPQLTVPGRRIQAIAAVERQLAKMPGDAAAWDLKRVLYNDLTEAEYLTHVVHGKPPEFFDHAYVHQIGLALLDDAARWHQGCELLRVAATGLAAQAPTIYLAIAKAHEKAGNFAEVWQAYEAIKQAGRAVGPKNLATQDRQAYFAVVKMLGEDAAKRGDTAAAIENYRLFTEYERAGLNTYRTLAELYEKQGDVWSALYVNEQGLVYVSTDQDLLARKDRYYYSVTPQELQARLEQVRKWFDVGYCKQKARWLVDHQGDDLELLDWATHLADLAQVAEPASMAMRVLRARMLRRRGENDQAIALLEEVRGVKPEKFPSGEEEDAWYLSCRLLGDLYLNVKPDQAVLCYQEYRAHAKSGADTVYKMGVAYENLGDHARARKCYKTVAAFENHPLAPEANSALHRLQATPQ